MGSGIQERARVQRRDPCRRRGGFAGKERGEHRLGSCRDARGRPVHCDGHARQKELGELDNH